MSNNAKHQRNYRARMAKDGRKEVRGIYATKDQAIKIKAAAKLIMEKKP